MTSPNLTPEACRIIDLVEIEASLLEVQANFGRLNAALDERRDPIVDAVRNNMIEGYALIDRLASEGIDLFDLHQIDWMLEINNTVLCGSDLSKRKESAQHIKVTSERFFDNREGGILDILEWYSAHRDESVWKRAAGIFVRILSNPQLFIEGNHRSGTLIASYLLISEGLPPFVLTVDNLSGFFNPASVVRRTPKHGIGALFKLPKIKKRYAEFLVQQSQSRFLKSPRCGSLLSKE